MEFANPNDIKEIMDLYERVIEKVNTSSVRLGWNTDIYPNIAFVSEAVSPDKQGSQASYAMLKGIEDICRNRGDLAIHLDVIDTNIPAYKLYTRNGYKEADCIKMYYEVVGTRDFWMLERVL